MKDEKKHASMSGALREMAGMEGEDANAAEMPPVHHESKANAIAAAEGMIHHQARDGMIAERSHELDGKHMVAVRKDMAPELEDDQDGDDVVAVVSGKKHHSDETHHHIEVDHAAVVHGKMSMALGGGGRFQALESKLSHRPGVTDPRALAASIGRKKLGNHKFSELASAGRSRAEGE